MLVAMAHKPKPIPIRLPKSIEDTVREVADLQGRTINSIVQEALMHELVLPDLTAVYKSDDKQLHQLLKEAVSEEINWVLKYAQFLNSMQVLLSDHKQLTPEKRQKCIDEHNLFRRKLLEQYTQTATHLRLGPVPKK